MRDGINGWKEVGYPTKDRGKLLNDLIDVNKIDFEALLVSEKEARQLEDCTFVDFREKSKYEKSHVEGANHVDYSDMFSKPMMEELNKSNSLVVIHDVPEVAGVIAMTLKLMDYPDVYIYKH